MDPSRCCRAYYGTSRLRTSPPGVRSAHSFPLAPYECTAGANCGCSADIPPVPLGGY